MKKYLFIIFTCLIGISSCEKDDFCVQDSITPNLVLRFYDKDDVFQLKQVERFSIIAQGKTDSLFTNRTTDSIAIPLNSLSEETVYTLKMNNIDGSKATNQTATLTIKYDSEDDYISRSCGFRVVFKDVNLEHTGWINNLSTSTISNINNQTNAHVQVYY
ncbi:hypothetical protein H0I31_10675 [Tenacibaculum sp. AHE15PA]|uniref:DUF6452 family protein n=1 Tax=unclassified Tenacibaculum TaxID=2635139 RepID=UPI001C4F3938|nr:MULTISPECIES: DUF6452 family protein [unclassified Tenacibaculum]QXP73994.1 hypothetical protein H0I30_02305 [Tenacibaculum sp. AHE14PA]QXP75638.1 hypothetical protein H0I31_10675 [Tenacibaculum sp. AHE15PA]